MKNLECHFLPYIDDWGLLAENRWEGGDSACEHFGALIICKWLDRDVFVDGIRSLEVTYECAANQLINLQSGLWRRHCAKNPHGEKNYWASEWNRGTRDNGTSAFMATIVFGDEKTFRAMYNGFKRRWWFCGNTFPRNVWARKEDHNKYKARWRGPFDPTPTIPDTALMLKSIAYRSPWTKKNTWFWDIFCCLIPALLIRRDIKKSTNDGNHLNAWLRINFCIRRGPTWISKLAHRLLPKDIDLIQEFGEHDLAAQRNPPMHLLTNCYQNKMGWDL